MTSYGIEVIDNLVDALDTAVPVSKTERWAFNGATTGVVLRFPNGRGLSVAIGPKSYGGRSGLMETVELDTDNEFVGFTDGWLDVSDVVAKAKEIAAE